MEHILTIRLQFEDLDTGFSGPMEEARKQVKDLGQEATRSGAAGIKTIQDLQSAWKEFDWQSPIQSAKRLFGSFIDWISNRVGWVGKLFLGLGALFVKNLVTAFRQLAGAQAELIKTFSMLKTSLGDSGEYGTTMGQKITRALMDISDIAQVTGESIGDIASRFSQLAQARVPIEDVAELTKVSFLAAKALGANVDQMTEFVGSLRVMGRLSTEEIGGPKGIIAKFSSVQNAVGLTEREMAGLIETTSRLIAQMTRVGGTAESIKELAGATATLTGMFGQLGLGAEGASNMMAKLFDPSAIGENALLISRMGYSMQEYLSMLSGGVVDQDKLVSGIISAAKEVEAIERTAGRGGAYVALQRAQMLGFSNLNEALAIAKDGYEAIAGMQDTGPDEEWATRAAEGMATITEAWTRFKNRFLGTIAKALAPMMGGLTDILVAVEQRFLSNEAGILNFFDRTATAIANFIKNIDFSKIIEWFKNIGEHIKNVIGWFKKAIPIILAVGAAFLALNILPGIIGSVGKLTGAIRGLGGAARAASGAGKVMGGMSQGLGTLTKVLSKAALGVLILIGLAGAIWILSKAMQGFATTKGTGAIGQMAASLGILVGVLVGIGLLFTTVLAPIVPAIAAFVGLLVILSFGLLTFARALVTFGEASAGLESLAAIASPELATGLKTTASAVAEFVKQFGFFQLMKADNLRRLGEAMKEFAISFWILGEIDDLTTTTTAMSQLSDAINILAETDFRRRVGRIADATKALAESLEILSRIRPEHFSHLGASMESVAKGVGDLLGAMSHTAEGSDRTGWSDFFTRWDAISTAFKNLAIGIWILGETQGLFAPIAEGLGLITDKLPGFITAFRDLGYQMEETGMRNFSNFLTELDGLEVVDFSPMLTGLEGLPKWLNDMGPAIRKFGERSADLERGVERTATMIKAIGESGGTIRFNAESGGLTAEVSEMGTITASIRQSSQEQTDALIEELRLIFDEDWRAVQDNMAVYLRTISNNTRSITGVTGTAGGVGR